MKFKAICTDIDGTLLDHRRELSDLTIKSFKALNGRIPVILASSRMPSAMRHLQAELGILRDPLICYNGGYILQYNGHGIPEVMYSTFIPVEVCEGIASLAAGTDVHISLYYEDNWYAPRWDYWTERESTITKVKPIIQDGSDVLGNWRAEKVGGHKVMCMGSEKEIDLLEFKLNESFGNDIHIYRSRSTYLELAPKTISKGTALQLLLSRKFSFTMDEVLAFGDNYNDIDLLQLSGKGIAVANARDEVKAVADELAADSKADGVALAVQKHLGLEI